MKTTFETNDPAWISPELQPWGDITACPECQCIDGEHEEGCSEERTVIYGGDPPADYEPSEAEVAEDRYYASLRTNPTAGSAYQGPFVFEVDDFDPFASPEAPIGASLPPVKVIIPGSVWQVLASSGDWYYSVTSHEDGLRCSCKHEVNGRKNGKPCRHVNEIEEMRMLEESGKRFDGEPKKKAEPIRLFVSDPADEDPFADVPTLAAKRNAEPARLLTWRESIALFSDPYFSQPELGRMAAA
jgi:hypothetical protein